MHIMKKIAALILLCFVQPVFAANTQVCLHKALAGYEESEESNTKHFSIENCNRVEDNMSDWQQFIRAHSEIQGISLVNCQLTDVGAFGVSSIMPLSHIIDLSSNAIGDVGATAIAKHENIYQLVLDANPITDNGIKNIASSNRVMHLKINHTKITNMSCRFLGENNSLASIDMDNNHLTSSCTYELSKNKNIRELSLRGNPIGDEGLLSLTSMPKLMDLFLDSTGITDEGMKTLSTMSELRFVSVSDNNITDVGVDYLTRLPNLHGLYLDNTRITDTGASMISKNITKYNKNKSDDGRVLLTLKNIPTLTKKGVSILRANPRIYVSKDSGVF